VLPFDTATWISIGIIFLAAFLSIFVINIANMQSYFHQYSHSISMLEVFRNFFGIGPARVTNRILGRLVLISFILWCLVIRTSYQSKLFEYTTTPIRKPEMKTLQELRAKNVTLYYPNESGIKNDMMVFINNVTG
jgi:hypothetical protein